jgi:hypothetical protein
MMMMMMMMMMIDATAHKDSWPPSEVSSILRDSCLLPTNPLFPASFPTPSLHLARGLANFFVLPVAYTSAS